MLYFFRASVFYCTENAKFWPILANLGDVVASLRTFWCTFTGLNNAVVSQNWQISGMVSHYVTHITMVQSLVLLERGCTLLAELGSVLDLFLYFVPLHSDLLCCTHIAKSLMLRKESFFSPAGWVRLSPSSHHRGRPDRLGRHQVFAFFFLINLWLLHRP